MSAQNLPKGAPDMTNEVRHIGEVAIAMISAKSGPILTGKINGHP
jgi:hypothetical protein